MHLIQKLPRLLLPLVLGSCIARIDVKKVDNACGTVPSKAKGVRYSLPQPFIVGKPQGNGKISYSVEYLPDPDNEYAVSAWSFMAKHKMNLQRTSRGFLKSVSYTKDDTAVATSMVDTAGNLLETHLKALNTAKKLSGGDGADDGNADGAGARNAGVDTMANGPVIYRVVEDPSYGVRLQPVTFRATLNGQGLSPSQQKSFETTGTPDGGGTAAPARPKLVSEKQMVLKKSAEPGPHLILTPQFDMKVKQDGYTLKNLENQDRTPLCNVVLDNADKAVIKIDKAAIATDTYILTLKVKSQKTPVTTADISITIKVDN